MVYYLAVFLFHSIATMPAVYWTEEDCNDAGKRMGVLYSCLGVLSGQTHPKIQIPLDYPPEGYPDEAITAEPKPDDRVDWEARRRFMHRTFQGVRDRLKDDSK